MAQAHQELITFEPEIWEHLKDVPNLSEEVNILFWNKLQEESLLTKKHQEDLEQWQLQGIQKAKEQFRNGECVDGELVMPWFRSLGTEDPLPKPTV